MNSSPRNLGHGRTSAPTSYLRFKNFGFDYNPNENDVSEYEL